MNVLPRRAVGWVLELIRSHHDSSIRFVIAAHVVMAVLDWFDRATFQTIQPTVLSSWFESPLWASLNITLAIVLLVYHEPPKVIWALMASGSVFLIWGVLNFYIGLTASHPVSLLGPTLLLVIAVPLSWTTADTMTEKAADSHAVLGV